MHTAFDLKVQKLIIFIALACCIVLQSVFTIDQAVFLFSLPSIFLVLTFKPDLLGFKGCFLLGILNDIFAMQTLGVSSIVFVTLKYFKSVYVSGAYKYYKDLFYQYLVYCGTLLTCYLTVMLFLRLIKFDMSIIVSYVMLILGFFVCDFLWLKVFRFVNKQPM